VDISQKKTIQLHIIIIRIEPHTCSKGLHVQKVMFHSHTNDSTTDWIKNWSPVSSKALEIPVNTQGLRL